MRLIKQLIWNFIKKKFIFENDIKFVDSKLYENDNDLKLYEINEI